MRGFWRGIAIFLLGGILGTGFGVALGFLLFPFVFPPAPTAEQLTEADRAKLVATGTFIHADPSADLARGSDDGCRRAVVAADICRISKARRGCPGQARA